MTSITSNILRQDIYDALSHVDASSTLIGEEDLVTNEETLYLLSIPGMTESLINGRNEPINQCVAEDALEW